MTRTVFSRAGVALCAALIAVPALAVDLGFPGPATETAALREGPSSYALPTGPWDGDAVPQRTVEGVVERRAWRIDAPGMTTLSLLAALRAQLDDLGFRTLFDCETETCGGFDFRYRADLLPEPEMHVDLGDFRFLSAEREEEVLSLMVSRSASAGFVQMTRVVPGQVISPVTAPGGPETGAATAADAPAVSVSAANDPGDVGRMLDLAGRVVLEDLLFPTGTTALADGDYPSLAALAEWLKTDPSRRVALVGHTDAAGGLDTNIQISRRRAQAVRAVLVGVHGAPPGQVVAEGVGYLVPRASNATEEGRRANRRVEVVLTDVP